LWWLYTYYLSVDNAEELNFSFVKYIMYIWKINSRRDAFYMLVLSELDFPLVELEAYDDCFSSSAPTILFEETIVLISINPFWVLNHSNGFRILFAVWKERDEFVGGTTGEIPVKLYRSYILHFVLDWRLCMMGRAVILQSKV